MPSMRNMPVYATREQLLAILADMINVVAANDSFEGSLSYEFPWSREMGLLQPDEPDDPRGPGFRVQASYRIGNSMGQGGLRMIGEMREVPNA